MMADPEVTVDLIDGGEYESNNDGGFLVRVYAVSGLPPLPADLKLWYVAQSVNGIPHRGDQHDSLSGFYCRSVNVTPATPNCADTFRVVAHYGPLRAVDKPPDDTQVAELEVGAVVGLVQTEKDKDGNAITVKHKWLESDSYGNEKDRTEEHIVSVSQHRAMPSFTYRRHEQAHPGIKANTYVGRVNSVGIWGGAKRTYLCAAINGRPRPNATSYDVEYVFIYDEDVHDQTVVFIDPKTDRPPIDLIEGQGIKTVKVQGEADFNNLNLTFG